MRVVSFFAELKFDKMKHGGFAGGASNSDNTRMPAEESFICKKTVPINKKEVA